MVEDMEMANCDVCNAALPENDLFEHFKTAHPEEFKKRCIRAVDAWEGKTEPETEPDPAYPCGCGVSHRRSERCGAW